MSLIPVLKLADEGDRKTIEKMLRELRLDAAAFALNRGHRAKESAAVQEILADVAQRGDAALVDSSRKFDDPNFSADQIRVTSNEMSEASARVPDDQMSALRRSIAQVREYQTHIMPSSPKPL